jgi:hypothetical protein
MKKPTKADPFSVWGMPPKGMLHGLSNRQIDQIKAYVSKVAGNAYTFGHEQGFDNGLIEAMCKVSLLSAREMKEQQSRTFARTEKRALLKNGIHS